MVLSIPTLIFLLLFPVIPVESAEASSQHGMDNSVTKCLDGNASTFYSSEPGPDLPVEVVLLLSGRYHVRKLDFIWKFDGNSHTTRLETHEKPNPWWFGRSKRIYGLLLEMDRGAVRLDSCFFDAQSPKKEGGGSLC